MLPMILYASSASEHELAEMRKELCKDLGLLCGGSEGEDREVMALSLAWLETVQYVEEGCMDDITCVEKVLRSFGYALSAAIEGSYHFAIDPEALARRVGEAIAYPREPL